MDHIPLFKPLLEEEELNAAISSLKMGWLGMGSYVKHFEEEISSICGFSSHVDRHVVAVSNGYAALHLALLMIGVGKDDEVITPAFNNAADFQAILACGAKPIFVDINESNLCIEPSEIESLITSRTKCIIAMDYGLDLCDHDALSAISLKHNIPILHDAAHSFGSFYNKKPIGNQHQYTMFSFDPIKTVTCIDAGAVVVNKNSQIPHLHAKRLLGMTQSVSKLYTNNRAFSYDIEELGFRYHLPNLHAAIGISQLHKLEAIRSTRQTACKRYFAELHNIPWLITPQVDCLNINPFLYYIRVKDGKREALRSHLLSEGIDTGIHWKPGHLFTLFEGCKRGSLNVTEKIASEILSIPLHSKMETNVVEKVISAIKTFK